MTRLSIGLTLLLMSFLAALDNVDSLHANFSPLGVQRWMTELAIAIAAVAFLFKAGSLHRRMLFPRRGMRLLAAGIAVYAVGLALATGAVTRALQFLPVEKGGEWDFLPGLAGQLPAQPLLLAGQVLLVLGAFRALCNLVSPAEYEADY